VTRVLVVDDSAVVRQTLGALLSPDAGFEVETAADPLIALEKMKRVRPQVIVLDLEMPRMDGLTFLRQIARWERPVPVVVCSGLRGRGSEAAMAALESGAVAVVEKPRLGVREFLFESALMLQDTIRGAAQARVRRRVAPVPARPRLTADAVLPLARSTAAPNAQPLIALGASTGGTEALLELLAPLPAETPAVLVVQHMPEGFTRAFAERLDRSCRLAVKEAEDGDRVLPGHVLLAPGDRHMILRCRAGGYFVEVSDGPLVSRHRPSVDVLFRSVAQAAGANAVGVILTGMGDDGAAGLAEMKQAGALTLAQDEKTSIVFGMPKEAIRRGAVDEVLPLDRLAWGVLRRVQSLAAASASDRRP
jgi:two-component system chemotaxis response regulator CheB